MRRVLGLAVALAACNGAAPGDDTGTTIDPTSWPQPTPLESEYAIGRVEAAGDVNLLGCALPDDFSEDDCAELASDLEVLAVSAAPDTPYTLVLRRLSGSGLPLLPDGTIDSYRTVLGIDTPLDEGVAVELTVGVRAGPQDEVPRAYWLAMQTEEDRKWPFQLQWQELEATVGADGSITVPVTQPGVLAFGTSGSGADEEGLISLPTTPGAHEVLFVHDGRIRRAVIAIPSSGSAPRSLVMVQHGSGQSPETVLQSWGWVEAAAASGAVLIVGEGTWGGLEALGDSFIWSGRVDTTNDIDPGYPENISLIERLLDSAEASLDIDSNRVFAVGFSGGGVLTHRIGAQLADRFTAIAPVAARGIGADEDYPMSPDQGHPLSVVMVMGVVDPSQTYDDQTEPFPVPGAVSSIEIWASRLGCDPTPTTESDGGLQRDRYSCPDGQQVALVSVADGVHEYDMMAPHGVTTTEAVWQFFSGL